MGNKNNVCDIEALEQFNYPKWTSWDFIRWKMPWWMGGGEEYLHAYKDSYIHSHRFRIKAHAGYYQIPPILLAGVVWAEAGGVPDRAKEILFQARRFDWSGSDWVDKNLTITHPPEKTSIGVSAM